MTNPISPQPDPSGAIVKHGIVDYEDIHSHSPAFGGEIAWNDIQQIATLNGIIKQQNRLRAQIIFNPSGYNLYLQQEDQTYFPGKLPYIQPLDPSGNPSQGYNIHGHKNFADGGGIVGAGNHDHRGIGYGGYAFAVAHPGTRNPLRSYKIEGD